METKTISGVRKLLAESLRLFSLDPADTEYQRGYQDAVEQLAEAAGVTGVPAIVERNPARLREASE